MSIEWGRLRVLDAVARVGSVTRAAALLHMTGPAVSQQLRRIEAEAGAKVVVPDGRGVRLTPEGKLLAEYAHRMADLMQQADNDLHRDAARIEHLRIAAIASVVRGLLTASLPVFLREHPRVRVSIEDGETADHLERLLEGRFDLVFAESWNTSPLRTPTGIRVQRLTREPLYLALPVGHPLSERRRLEVREVSEERWATCARGSDPHTALVRNARQHGIDLDMNYHVADHVTQLALVRAGLAVACLPRPTGGLAHEPGVVFRPLDPVTYRDIVLLTSNRTAPLALEAFMTHLREALHDTPLSARA
ncbi:LysR family transcriptional regulator [Glycomyces salinus]|uniref:LysR family transcriptional regulator n=1 Tax=Glycomyces salinus TaxID=980294 RepID=UPI0018EC84F1|nr:LysR family transcriptional regulator [Glycomyces salinus]